MYLNDLSKQSENEALFYAEATPLFTLLTHQTAKDTITTKRPRHDQTVWQ